MDFATFTTETLAFLWRVGDQDLIANLPKIVRTAENRMRTDLKVSDDDVTLNTQVDAWPEWDLPADLDNLVTLIWSDRGPGKYTSPYDFGRAQSRPQLVPGAIGASHTMVNQFEYTIHGNRLAHRWDNASVATPVDVRLVYTPKSSGLEAGNDSLFNEYTALYESAVYHEACKFLLEEERAEYFEKEYAKYLDRALAEQASRQFAGSPLVMQMPRQDIS